MTVHPLPPPPRHRTLMFAVPSITDRWGAGLRFALSFGIPAVIALLLGQPNAVLIIITFGAFAAPYGEGKPYRVRWRVLLAVGLALTAAGAIGAMVGSLGAPMLVEVGVLTGVAMLGAYTVLAARLGPPGSYFVVLVCGAAAVIARGGLAPLVIVGWIAVGVLSSLAVSMPGVLIDRGKPERDADPVSIPLGLPSLGSRLRRSLSVDSHATVTAMRVGLAVVVTGCFGIALGLERPDWAIITAIVTLHMGLDRVHGTVYGLHRFAGTAAGIGLYALLHQLPRHGLVLIAVLMALQFLLVLFVAGNYAIAVVFITPIALIVTSTGNPNVGLGPMIRERLIETALGVLVAVTALWVADLNAHRRTLLWVDARVLDAAQELLAELRKSAPTEPRALNLQRALHFELIGSALGGKLAVHNERRWTEHEWSRHTRITELGHDLLTECWSKPSGPLRDPDSWEYAAQDLRADRIR